MLQVTENSTETGLRTNGNSLAHISGKYSWVWLRASHGLNPGHSHAISFSPSLDYALALFSCIFSHGDETATRPPLKRGLKFPGVIIKPPN